MPKNKNNEIDFGKLRSPISADAPIVPATKIEPDVDPFGIDDELLEADATEVDPFAKA